MTSTPQPMSTFAYQAQTLEGSPLSGTIDAANAREAMNKLIEMRLRVLELSAAGAAARPKPLRGDDFIAFNQQLAHLTAAGLPLEQGLRLIAEDMDSGRLSRTIRQIADELDQGMPLATALEKHRGRFPASYARLIDAGMRANNLPGVLFNLSRHLELTARLRSMIWRSVAYPLMVLAGLSAVLFLLGWYVFPSFEQMFHEFKLPLPGVTVFVLMAGRAMPFVLGGVVVLLLIIAFFVILLRRSETGQAILDAVLLRIPLIGPILRRNLLAGWCNALKLGIEAGMDLPAAMQLASDVSSSAAIRSDTLAMIAAMDMGRGPSMVGGAKMIPPAITSAIAVGIETKNLPQTLAGLTQMYQEQAELRLGTLPGIITPSLVLILGLLIGWIIAALMLPILSLIRGVGS